MISDQFVKVFDVLDAGFEAWTFPAFGLIFVAVGLVILIGPRILRRLRIPFLETRRWQGRLVGYFFVIFAILWTGIAFYVTYSQYRRNTMIVEQNRCGMVEGPVEHFVPMPRGGHGTESFSVDGITFKYSDFNITGGFNHTASHGGPITPGSYVRICYDPSNNLILRLEIRGFDGTMPRRPGLFPFPPSSPDRISDGDETFGPKWFGLPIAMVGLLDLLGLITLYRPYLRTFLRIGSKTERLTLRPDLAPEAAIKLSRSLIYWDRPDHVIWLRPRGLVLFQIPMMVARIQIDADDRSVLGWDVRLSSGATGGFALGLVAFCWFVFVAIPAGQRPSPAIFAAFGVIAIVIAGVNFRTLRSRMTDLVDEAFLELAA